MHRVATNKIKVNFHFDEINGSFSFIRIKSSEKKYWNALYLDALVKQPVVKSIVHENEPSFYTMLSVSEDEAVIIVEQIVSRHDSLSAEVISPESIEPHYLAQLLINSLSSNKSKFFSFNNLSGKFYYSHPSWFKKKGKTIWQIPTIQFKVTKDFTLQESVVTFTSISNRKWMTITEKRFHELPRYYFNSSNYTLKRKLPNEKQNDEDIFIMRQVKGAKKTVIPLIDFSSWDKFLRSKAGAWYHLLSKIETDLKNYIDIQFESWDNAQWSGFKQANSEFKEERLNQLFQEKKTILIDNISNNDSVNFSKRFSEFLKEQLEISIRINTKPREGDFCIRLINNKENQEGDVDQYLEAGKLFSKRIAVHHITFEDFSNKFEFYLNKEISACESSTRKKLEKQNKTALAAVKNILKEIVIKDDVLNNNITVTDWGSNQYKKDWMFAWKDDTKDVDRIGFLKICPNGNLEFEVLDLSDLFSSSKYDQFKKYFEPLYSKGNFKPEGLIKTKDGFINLIGTTNLRALPAFKKVGNALEKETEDFELDKDELISIISRWKKSESSEVHDDIINQLNILPTNVINRKNALGLKFKKPNLAKELLNELLFEEKGIILRNFLRGKKKKYELFNSNIDIVYRTNGEGVEYFVGDKSKGIKASFKNYCNIRRAVPIENAPILFDELIETMNVDFVKHEGLTVLPFPFKYIREYLKIQNLLKYVR
ncbi:hypothetical protein [Echinicola rosea]|uniref:ATPase n=1 Tax=Echinicola rosea TaxID=1807691 RepID=A0ABQ1USQ4_9BACT|nr:hypothetical protein [Echinicola rosea]GGF24324.1 ATPase [Echinicola rosea]